MTQPWEKYQTIQNPTPWEKYSKRTKSNEPRESYSKAESLGMSALKAASHDNADEIGGAALGIYGALKGKGLKKSYQEGRGKIREEMGHAYEDNPDTFTGGEIGTSILTVFIPGMGWMNAAKGAKFLNAVGKGALTGGLIGAGSSTADLTEGEVEDFAGDVGFGTMAGSAVGGATNQVGKALSSLTPSGAGKKLANIFMNTPEEITETYIKNPKGVLNAPLRHTLAREIEDQGIDPLKREIVEGSQQSRHILDKEGAKFKGSELAVHAQELADGLESRMHGIQDDPQRMAAVKWLRNLQKEYGMDAVPEKIETSTLLDESGRPFVTKTPAEVIDKDIPANRLKDSIQSIDRNVDYDIGAGQFGKIDQNVKKDLRSKWDSVLKDKSAAYADQMAKVSADSDLLGRVNEVASSPRGWANVFRRIETDKYGGGQLPAQTLGDLDTRMGTKFLEKAKLSNAREAFDKSVTNGSRNVNLFAAWLREVPVLKFIAPIMGATVDKYGRKVTMGAVNTAVALEKAFQTNGPKQFLQVAKPIFDAAQKGNVAAALTFQILDEAHPSMLESLQSEEEGIQETSGSISDNLQEIIQKNPQALGKYAQPLQNAAQRGPQALAAANFILQQTQPEYRKLVMEPLNGEEEEE